MNTTLPILAVDAGQSSIRARLHQMAGPAFQMDFPPLLTDQPLMPQLESVIREVLLQRPAANVRVAAGLSGLTPLNADAAGVLDASRDRGVTAVYLVHDSVSGYLGCLGDRRGSAVAAGTGVVTLATGTSSYSRVDGWGNIMGDAGSGYWIGRAGLEAAMRAHDRRGVHTAILDLLHEDFPNLETAYIDIQSHPERIAFVASYARKIIDLSPHDKVSAHIVDRATDELALSVGASLRNTWWDPGSCPSISWAGSILSNPLMSGPLHLKLKQAWPNAEILPPQGGPLDGVARIPDLPVDHPLHPLLHISTATALELKPAKA
ncbi:N-acetylglucosamine kinase [Paenarthrobacter sp. NPDC056912]|uniref:N-acetylglucosamine kinase n=1 Tax=Paenarthrobacter sp. NPDC056912 TaxID=3345965 RepID=UPI00366EEE51